MKIKLEVVSFAENQADYWLKTENGKQYLMAKEEVILPCDEATLVGRHNYMNILSGDSISASSRHKFRGNSYRTSSI